MSEHHNPLSPRSLLASIAVGLVVTIVGGVAVYQLTQPQNPESPNKKRTRVHLPGEAQTEPEPAVSRANNAAIDVIAERAECDQVNIRVVIAASIRDSKATAMVDFAPIPGYFVDPQGKRYESGLTTMENKPIESMATHQIKPGETYRYCLGPVEFLEPGMGADCPIKKVTVYLNGLPPRVVAVQEGWWRR